MSSLFETTEICFGFLSKWEFLQNICHVLDPYDMSLHLILKFSKVWKKKLEENRTGLLSEVPTQ